MSAIYLSRIELQEFRSFAKLVVDLPPQPGALIIHGSNGLGKSSFFDGIEWALTSKVDHFRSARTAPTAHYLRRWDAPADRQTHIRLNFGEYWFRRTLAGGLDTNGLTDVTAFLQRRDWEKAIGHLDRYLLLTHFLGQSTISRMTHRDAKERWEFLQEPAQSDRAMQIVRVLHGHGSSTPARAFERRSQALVTEAAQLERLLSDEEQHWRDAQLSGAIDDRAARQEASRLRQTLRGLLNQFRYPLDSVPHESPDPLEGPIGLHAVAQEAFLSLEQRVARGRALVRKRQEAEVEIVGVNAGFTALQEQAGALDTTLNEERDRISRAHNMLEQAVAEHRTTQDAVIALANYERAREATLRGRMDLTRARDLTAELIRQVEDANAEVRKAERRRALAHQLLQKRAGAAEEFERLTVKLAQLAKAEAISVTRHEATVRREALTQGNSDLDERVTAALAACQAASRRVESLKGALSETQSTVGAVSTAVATIAARLPAEVCECPVCSTSFSSAEELRDRINGAVDRLAPAVAALENELATAVNDSNQAEARHAALVAHAAALEACRLEVDELASEMVEALGAVVVDGNVGEGLLPTIRATLEAEADRLTIQMHRADRWLHHPVVGGAPGTVARWARAIEARNELASSLADQHGTVERLDADLQHATRELNKFSGAVGIAPDAANEVVTLVRRERLERQRAAEAELVSARRHLQDVESQHASTNASMAQTAAQLAQLDSQARAIRGKIEHLEGDWHSLNLGTQQISADVLEERSRELPEFQMAIQSTSQHIQRLREGRLASSRQERHRAVLNEMRSVLGAAPNTERDSLRRMASDRQSALLHHSEAVLRAKKIAQHTNTEVIQRVGAFNEQFLAPLSTLMNRINRTILSEPEIGLDLKIESRRIEQRVMTASSVPDFVFELDPQLVHSEGQMAALAVSMLTAASLTFQWSRWPALIMDDPLQHNDIVHAAAFADMLRNLVLARRYQILLSTHDLGQAEFLRRKFQAAEIPCTAVHLLGRGARGVESRITYDGFTPS